MKLNADLRSAFSEMCEELNLVCQCERELFLEMVNLKIDVVLTLSATWIYTFSWNMQQTSSNMKEYNSHLQLSNEMELELIGFLMSWQDPAHI